MGDSWGMGKMGVKGGDDGRTGRKLSVDIQPSIHVRQFATQKQFNFKTFFEKQIFFGYHFKNVLLLVYWSFSLNYLQIFAAIDLLMISSNILKFFYKDLPNFSKNDLYCFEVGINGFVRMCMQHISNSLND